MRLDEFLNALKALDLCEYQSEAFIFIEESFGVSRMELLADRSRDFDTRTLTDFIEKRKEGIPLQHILGKWYFMGECYKVSPDCLIPRADTEAVVEVALSHLSDGGRVADLCTGSGCIGISILKNKPKTRATLVDISERALNIAKDNAKALGVYDRCELIEGDVAKDILDGEYDMIISNPPYIKTNDIPSLSREVQREPILALDGGDDGLDIIKELLRFCPPHIKKGGYLVLEFGYDQGSDMEKLLDNSKKQGTISEYEMIYDYGKNIRGCIAKK